MANGLKQVTIQNVIFDIGNVLVRWDPQWIIEKAFGKERASEPFIHSIFPGENVWIPLNLGEITATEAMQRYRDRLGLTAEETDRLWLAILDSLTPVPGAIEFMEQLKSMGMRLFALSDNVHEIVSHLKAEQDFWPYFEGAVISAEVGMLKPDPKIYQHLLTTHQIEGKNTIFFDDIEKNVQGAKSVGIEAFVFTTVAQAKADMRTLDLVLA